MILPNNKPSLLASLCLMTVIGLSAGCMSVSSGLQSGELPPNGTFVAENGMQFNVLPLSLTTLPPAQAYTTSGNSKNSRVHELLRSSNSAMYRIAPGDILSIKLFSYPQITPMSNDSASNPYASGYPVDQEGYIQFPLIGRIKANGLTSTQFTNNLRSQLQRYLKHPDPQVKVINYRSNKFFIDGEVVKSGEYNINDTPISLYSAISMAGGATKTGDTNNIVLTRNGMRYELGLRDLQNMGIAVNQLYVQDGDSIHINGKDQNKVFVLGEFGKVAPLEIPEQGLTLAQVVGESEGLNANTANAAKIYVVRDHANRASADIYYVDLQTVTNLALANRFVMQSNDIVYVDPTGLTRWSRFINAILPSASTVSILSGL